MVASASYQVSVKLDSQLNVMQAGERPLHWVHATLLEAPPVPGVTSPESGAEACAAPPSTTKALDVRLKLTTR